MTIDTIGNLNNSTSATWNPQASAASGNAMKSTDFLQILMAQLTHQNPMEPMNDADMMNQFAQLNSLQELQEMGSVMDKVSYSSQASYAANLIGKQVTAIADNGILIEGKVTAVMTVDSNLKIDIGGQTAQLKNVREIKG